MTNHEILSAPWSEAVSIPLLLVVTLQMTLIFASYQDGRSRKYKIFSFLFSFSGLIVMYLFLFDMGWDINDPEGVRKLPAILAGFRRTSVAYVILYEAVSLILAAIAFRNMVQFRKNHLTAQSIKEMMDLLPAGLAFADPEGTVVFSNLVMNDLSRQLTGRGMASLNGFHDLPPGEETSVELPDHSAVWQLSSESLEVDGEPFTQLTATDITEQAAINRELAEKNAKLRDIHMRLDIYNKQADRIIIAQELLTARMMVHNEVGNVLLESRHYLADPASFDEELLLQALKNTNTYLLREYEEDDSARDPLADALDMAAAIGVDVSLLGRIPEKDPSRTILSAAINECAANAVKHAGGDRLSVEIRNQNAETIFILKSNGEEPRKAVRESGGLLSLRTLVENEGGTMQTDIIGGFQLTIHLPEK